MEESVAQHEEQHEEQQEPNEEATQRPNSEQEDFDYYYSSAWPVPIRFDVHPTRTHHFAAQFRTKTTPNNFLKSIKWSPDGSCFLTSSEDNTLHLFPSPEGNMNNGNDYVDPTISGSRGDSYDASVVVNEGESVYDLCWFPYMTASDPVSCVVACTTRDHPIHLWDAITGQLRCTYRAYDAMDEISAAFSVAFNPTGTKIFAGYNKVIRVFDVHRPGRDFQQYSTVHGKKEGQAGIISAIAFSPTQSKMLATGSYSQTTAVYSEDNMELLYILHGQEGGVTHVQFSKDGNYIYTGGRKDPYILCWDIRKAVDVVYKLYRSTESTNQRILFDLEPNGQHLATGGQDGYVHIYNLQTGLWTSSFQAAMDTVNGISFHPYLPMAATSSGHRRYEVPDEGPDENDPELLLNDFENCASLWTFAYDAMGEAQPTGNGQSEHENTHQET